MDYVLMTAQLSSLLIGAAILAITCYGSGMLAILATADWFAYFLRRLHGNVSAAAPKWTQYRAGVLVCARGLVIASVLVALPVGATFWKFRSVYSRLATLGPIQDQLPRTIEGNAE